jgi:hypothetical protein
MADEVVRSDADLRLRELAREIWTTG